MIDKLQSYLVLQVSFFNLIVVLVMVYFMLSAVNSVVQEVDSALNTDNVYSKGDINE